jgi:hypothetical protein
MTCITRIIIIGAALVFVFFLCAAPIIFSFQVGSRFDDCLVGMMTLLVVVVVIVVIVVGTAATAAVHSAIIGNRRLVAL